MDLRHILNDDVPYESVATRQGRTGKWSPEEERYATALILNFTDGTLAIPAGTSLRSFLATKLRCSPMRVSTKLSMDTLSGRAIPKRLGQKRFFPRREVSLAERHSIERELHDLERAFLSVENLERDQYSDFTEIPSTQEHRETAQRIGSWSHEEQIYACALIDAFLKGQVTVPEGVTLRAFLAERLCCNPMRVSKKLATGKIAAMEIPKRLGSTMYRRQLFDACSIARVDHELRRLRRRCFPATSVAAENVFESLYLAPLVSTPPSKQPSYCESTAQEIEPVSVSARFVPSRVAMKERRLTPLSFPPSPVRLPSFVEGMHCHHTSAY